MPKQIKVENDVYQDLTDIGKKNETYSQIIRRLLDYYNKKQQRPGAKLTDERKK